jgi:hypothetical protein
MQFIVALKMISDAYPILNLQSISFVYEYIHDRLLMNNSPFLSWELFKFFNLDDFSNKLKYSTEIPIDIYFNFIDNNTLLLFINSDSIIVGGIEDHN